MPLDYKKIAILAGIGALLCSPTIFLNTAPEPPKLREARMAKREKNWEESRKKEERKQEELDRHMGAVLDIISKEQEKKAALYEKPKGHLGDATAGWERPITVPDLKEKNSRD